MIFPEYRQIFAFFLAVSFSVFGIWLFRAAKHGRFTENAFFKLIAVVTIFLGFLLMSTLILFRLGASSEAPVFSPDHKMAAVIKDAGQYSLASSVVIDIYSSHGLIVHRIFESGLNLVSAAKVRWISDSELVVTVEGEGGYRNEVQNIDNLKIRWE